jgi:hypothetical protein
MGRPVGSVAEPMGELGHQLLHHFGGARSCEEDQDISGAAPRLALDDPDLHVELACPADDTVELAAWALVLEFSCHVTQGIGKITMRCRPRARSPRRLVRSAVTLLSVRA